MGIIIFNLNPSFDRWLIIKKNQEYTNIIRSDEVHSFTSGKGLNIARALKYLEFDDYVCVCVLGGKVGDIIQDSILKEGLHFSQFNITNDNRINTIVVDTLQNSTLVINEQGPTLLEHEKEELKKYLISQVRQDDSIVIGGSAVANFNTDDFLDILDILSKIGVDIKVDIAGKILNSIIKYPLDLLKINEEEFNTCFGLDITDYEHCVAFKKLHPINQLVVTQGKHGATLIDVHNRVYQSNFLTRFDGIAVGSGDSFFAGWLYAEAQKYDFEECLKLAMACGAANMLHYGPGVLDNLDVTKIKEQVRVERKI